MKKTVIVISGLMNTGKTATIRKFYGLLLKKYSEIEDPNFNIEAGEIQKTFPLNGLKIGINSIGDTSEDLTTNLKIFLDTKCDIIVCATRTKRTSNKKKTPVDPVQNLNEEGYKIIQFSNLHSWQKENTDNLNDESAKFLLNVFEYLLIKK